jgi:glycosyltransferase involved in cell wall biosynthesis
MTLDLSVVICTHNPRSDYLEATLASLRGQVPPVTGWTWELIVIDNASATPLSEDLDLSWHAAARVVREERLGLTHARLRSFHEARGAIILYVDDDNVLVPTYFRDVLAAFDAHPELGGAGGKALPRYEVVPPAWFADTGISLACRDLGDEAIWYDWRGIPPTERRYPECAPIGAGMAIRRKAYAAYVAAVTNDPVRSALGRKGSDLASGEDNDMILTLLAGGWSVAYLPQLSLDHLIPARRLEPDYLGNYAYSSNRTWIGVLSIHGLCPWRPVARWTTPLRKARAYLTTRAWQSTVNRIHWRGACGIFDGRATYGRRDAA